MRPRCFDGAASQQRARHVIEELGLDLLAAMAVSEASQPEVKPLNHIPPQSLSPADLDD